MARSKSATPTRVTVDLTSSFSEDDGEGDNVVNIKGTTATASSILGNIEGDMPRRSSRERVSRFVTVNGHQVLAVNNYTVTGDSYMFDSSAERNAVRRTDDIKTEKKAKQAPKIRHVSKAELIRKDHNAAISKKSEVHKVNRLQYFAENADVCAPFLDERTTAYLVENQRFSVPEVKISKQPKIIQGQLRDYQLAGLNWIVNMHEKGVPMILGDEMGLGKTLQTISFIAYLKEFKQYSGPSLVICPLSVITSWTAEIIKWAPDLKYLRIHAPTPETREEQMRSLTNDPIKYDIVVTTYDMIKASNTKTFWSRTYFNYVVLDEGHLIKNHKTEISQRVRSLHYESTLILTGTPLQNNLVELWAILNYLYPEYFSENCLDIFTNAFDLTANIIQTDVLLKAHKFLNLFMLRRLKVEVEKLLPKKIETNVYCPLSLKQRQWYKAILLRDIQYLMKDADETSGQKKYLLNIVMQLRKVCGHPYLFPGAEDKDTTTMEDLVSASGKLTVLDMILRGLFRDNHRVVLFSQFTMTLDIIEDYCIERGWKYGRLDGSVNRANRNFLVNAFNCPESPFFIFLVSTRAGGMGLNLQTADTCILYDTDWNPQADLQAMARVHRIGQKKVVHIYRLICSGTIEERVLQRAEKKLYLDQVVNRGKKDGVDMSDTGLSSAELLETLRFGANAVFGANADASHKLPTEIDISLLLDRNRSEEDNIGNLKGGVAKTAKDFDTEKGLSGTQIFDGVDFKKIHEQETQKAKNLPKDLKKLVDHFSQDLPSMGNKRVRKSRILMVNGQGSGYGKTYVPVLTSNNYDLNSGESSVYLRELKKKPLKKIVVEKPKKIPIDHHVDCQVCGLYGRLLTCPRCPVAVHPACIGIETTSLQSMKSIKIQSCPHHRCMSCDKDRHEVGGLLFPCQSCHKSFCEDCLPSKADGLRFLYTCPPRFCREGFSDNRVGHIYINCSHSCEQHAISSLNWKPPIYSKKNILCPPALDIAWAFTSVTGENFECQRLLSTVNDKIIDLVKDPCKKSILTGKKRKSDEGNSLSFSDEIVAKVATFTSKEADKQVKKSSKNSKRLSSSSRNAPIVISLVDDE